MTRDGVSQAWASFNLPVLLAQPIGGTTYPTQFSYGPDHQRWKQIAYYSEWHGDHAIPRRLLEKETTTSTGKTYWRHYVRRLRACDRRVAQLRRLDVDQLPAHGSPRQQ